MIDISSQQATPEDMKRLALEVIALSREEWPNDRSSGVTVLASNDDHSMEFIREVCDQRSYGVIRVVDHSDQDRLVAYSRTSVLEDIGRDLLEFNGDYFSQRGDDCVPRYEWDDDEDEVY